MLIMVDSNEGTERNLKDNNLREQVGLKRQDESNIRVVKRLQKYFGKVQQAPLTCGDINAILDGSGTLAIERKRARDFLSSVAEGHIFKQVENMANNSTWHCIIIEGIISFNVDDLAVVPTFDKFDNVTGYEVTGWPGKSVRGAMYAIQWSGCPILTVDPVNLPAIVADLIRFCSKPSEHTQMLGRKRYVTFPSITLSEEILASFPGVGLKRAKSLLKFAQGNNDNKAASLGEALVWGNVLDLIDRKSRPEGWGDKTIENFRSALGLETGELTIIENKNRKSPVRPKKGSVNGKGKPPF